MTASTHDRIAALLGATALAATLSTTVADLASAAERPASGRLDGVACAAPAMHSGSRAGVDPTLPTVPGVTVPAAPTLPTVPSLPLTLPTTPPLPMLPGL